MCLPQLSFELGCIFGLIDLALVNHLCFMSFKKLRCRNMPYVNLLLEISTPAPPPPHAIGLFMYVIVRGTGTV